MSRRPTIQEVSCRVKFETIREFARRGILSEHVLRLMVKRGEIPGIQSGNRFLINVRVFLRALGCEEGGVQ